MVCQHSGEYDFNHSMTLRKRLFENIVGKRGNSLTITTASFNNPRKMWKTLWEKEEKKKDVKQLCLLF